MTEKKQPARPAEYGKATPEQVAAALLKHGPSRSASSVWRGYMGRTTG